MFGSRQKGSVAEREVAKLLEGWWSPVEPGCRYVKTPLSGGWSTPQVRGDFRVSGDLATTAKLWPFTIEVKRRESWAWAPFLAGKPTPILGWWRQALAQSVEMNLEPMLWFRHNREPWNVMFPSAYRILGAACEYPPSEELSFWGPASALLESDPWRAVREDQRPKRSA
jgi:hypothetical protein